MKSFIRTTDKVVTKTVKSYEINLNANEITLLNEMVCLFDPEEHFKTDTNIETCNEIKNMIFMLIFDIEKH